MSGSGSAVTALSVTIGRNIQSVEKLRLVAVAQ